MALQNPKKLADGPSHELIVNYTSQVNVYSCFPSVLWTESWTYAQNAAYAFVSESTDLFPYNAILNRLRRAVITHSNFEIFPQARKQIVRIFFSIFNHFVEVWAGNKQSCRKCEHKNQIEEDMNVELSCFERFIGDYQRVQPRLKRFEALLAIILAKHTTAKQIRKQAHHILSKELLNCVLYEKFVNQCLDLLDNYRDHSLKPSMTTDNLSSQSEFLKKLQLLIETETFPLSEYIQRSHKYFSEILPKIPKNLEMFSILHRYLENQSALARIIQMDQSLNRTETWKIGKVEGRENMLSVFCKEVLEELYGDMVEYLDYLLKYEQNQQNVIQDENEELSQTKRINVLRHLWVFTKLLKKHNLQQYEGLLLSRFAEIVKDLQQYITKQSIHKIITHKNNLLNIVKSCFDESPKFMNQINNGIEYILMENESQFNDILCSIILSPAYKYPQSHPSQEQQMANFCSIELFKLTPSKEQFIRKFEQQFSRYVVSSNNLDSLTLSQQELFIKTIQKQCGHTLSKNIQKMVQDVWRQQKCVYYESGLMRCRVLSPDWPEFVGNPCRLVDQLLKMQHEFEEEFMRMGNGQNQKKTLKWVWQYGTIVMNLWGIQSNFSQLQASIVILLDRSFRPMKSRQFSQVLEFSHAQVLKILGELVKNNIISYEQESEYYELNRINTLPYNFRINQKAVTNKQKKSLQRDYGIIIEAYITRILKKRKTLQKTDLMKLLNSELKTYRPNLEQLAVAIERLCARDIIVIQKARGMIKYVQ